MTEKENMIAVLLYDEFGEFKFYLGEEHLTVKKIFNFVRRVSGGFASIYAETWWYFRDKEVYELGDLEYILGTELYPDFTWVSSSIWDISDIVRFLNNLIEHDYGEDSLDIPPVLEEHRDAIFKKVMKIALSRFNSGV